MKIGLDVSQIIYGTGVSRYTQHLLSALIKLNSPHKFVLFGGSLRRLSELNRILKRFPQTSVKTYPLAPAVTNFLWNTLHLFPIETFTGPLDVFHTSDWTEPPSKAPKVTTVHDLGFFIDPEYAPPSVRQTQKKRLYWVAKESSQIIVPSRATKNDLIKFLDIAPERINVIYEAPTMEAPLLDQQLTTAVLHRYNITSPYLLVPGCGHPRKNIRRIVTAFLKLKLPQKLVITGLPTPQEAQLASNKVVFPGFIAADDLPFIFAAADALVYTSLHEGFGLPVLDAFVCQTPVLTSSTSSLPEAAGDAAILVNPASEGDIATGILEVLSSRQSLIRLGNKQLKHFSWESTAKQTLSLYEFVAKQPKIN